MKQHTEYLDAITEAEDFALRQLMDACTQALMARQGFGGLSVGETGKLRQAAEQELARRLSAQLLGRARRAV
jgi:hypothetical protein